MPGRTAAVWNPKDPRDFFNMDTHARKIIGALNIPRKRFVGIMPVCSTRMESKGVRTVIDVWAGLKRRFESIALVVANSHAGRNTDQTKLFRQYAVDRGLADGEDFLFTSDMMKNRPLPRKTVSDLFRISNVFVFASWRETCGNVFQEALISGNLLVLNSNLQCLHEMVQPVNVLFFPGTYCVPGMADGQPNNTKMVQYSPGFFKEMSGEIAKHAPRLDPLWHFSYETIWEEQFKPLIYDEEIKEEPFP
jgi:hypothetical protein